MNRSFVVASAFLVVGCRTTSVAHDPDAGDQIDAQPSCADLSAPAATLAGLDTIACDLDHLTAAPRELAAASDGSLYVVTVTGTVEHLLPAAIGCAFHHDLAFASPPGDWRSIEATSDGRVYMVKAEGTTFTLAWIGSAQGQCTDTVAYRAAIAAAGDGTVVMPPASGDGLRAIDTATCAITNLPFASADPVRELGRVGGDVIYGCFTGSAARARYALDGTLRFREPTGGFAGSGAHTLEHLGPTVASWAVGYLDRYDDATGDALPPIKYDAFFSATTLRADADAATFSVRPDGVVGYILSTATGTAACPVVPSLYRLTLN